MEHTRCFSRSASIALADGPFGSASISFSCFACVANTSSPPAIQAVTSLTPAFTDSSWGRSERRTLSLVGSSFFAVTKRSFKFYILYMNYFFRQISNNSLRSFPIEVSFVFSNIRYNGTLSL